MASKLIAVATAMIDSVPESMSTGQAAQDLLDQAGATLSKTGLPPRCILLLATADWCRLHPELAREIRRRLADRVGYAVPLIGGSMARVFSSCHPDVVAEHGVTLALICSRDLHICVGSLPKPHDNPDTRSQQVKMLANELREASRNHLGLGTSAQRDLLAFLPGYLVDCQGRRCYLDNELYEEILDAFDHRMILFGASSADDLVPRTGYQFANDECLESGLALAIIESDLCTGAAMTHGFERIGGLRISVDELEGGVSDGYVVTRLNGMPAARCIRELVEQYPNALERPVFGVPFAPDHHVFLPLDVPHDDSEPVRLGRKVAAGDSLYLLDADASRMLEAGRRAARSAIHKAGLQESEVAFLLVLACTGRFRKYGANREILKEAIDSFGQGLPGIPIIGGLCGGEFAEDEHHQARGNNLSAWVTCLGDRLHNRARNKILQRALIEAGAVVLSSETPREVMRAALEGATKAGGTGGQICRVEKVNGPEWRILGKNFGYSYSTPGAPDNWELVLAGTERRAPDPKERRSLPLALIPWAISALPGGDTESNSASIASPHGPREPEDILTCCVRTRHAIFVPDCRKPEFQCDLDLVLQAGLRAQLVLPLIGRDGFAIATMQIGFAERTVLDEESFGLWILFAQKVAASLERSQELKERRMMEEMMQLGAEIAQRPLREDDSPSRSLVEYIDKLILTIGADYAHLRIPKLQKDSGPFELVAASTPIGELHQVVRPFIEYGEGSCRAEVLTSKGMIANTRSATQRLFQGMEMPCAAGEEKYQQEWTAECDLVFSTAMIPLKENRRVFGVLAVDSYREYFFTPRIERVVRACAGQAASILSKKRADYLQARRDNQAKRLARLQNDIVRELIRSSQPGADWRPVLDLVRAGFLVEAAAFYYVRTGRLGERFLGERCISSESPRWTEAPPVPDEQELKALIEGKTPIWLDRLNEADLRRWTSPPSPSDLCAVPLVSADQEVRGVLIVLERKQPAEAPYGFEDQIEQNCLIDIAREIASAQSIRAARKLRNALQDRVTDLMGLGKDGLIEAVALHDLMSPLAGIQRAVDTMRKFPEFTREKREEELRYIEKQKALAIQFIHEWAAQPGMDVKEETVQSLVTQAMNSLQHQKAEFPSDAKVENKITASVRVHLQLMVQAIVGLMSNAVEALENKWKLTIRTERSPGGECASIVIYNSGPHYEQDEIDGFFTIGHSSKPDHLGVGLPIVRRVVEAAGGSLQMGSPEEGGVEARIVLPVVKTVRGGS